MSLAYEVGNKDCLVTDKFNIYNCKDVSKKHNNLHCELFHKAAKASELGREIKNAKNVSLRVYVQRIVTYK